MGSAAVDLTGDEGWRAGTDGDDGTTVSRTVGATVAGSTAAGFSRSEGTDEARGSDGAVFTGGGLLVARSATGGVDGLSGSNAGGTEGSGGGRTTAGRGEDAGSA